MREETVNIENLFRNPSQQNVYFTIVKIDCYDESHNC